MLHMIMIQEDFIFDDNFRKTTTFYFITSFWNTDKKTEFYEQLKADFPTIFPGSNRNAGGPQYIHHLVQNMSLL